MTLPALQEAAVAFERPPLPADFLFDADAVAWLDDQDPLSVLGDAFEVPRTASGARSTYLCGNSLGPLPTAARAGFAQHLADWSRLGVDGHFQGAAPWFDYHERFSNLLAPIVGAASSDEVVAMNALTVNLHLLMVSFYRPTATRFRIITEAGAFPSDRYALASQATLHGFDPIDAIVEVGPRPGAATIDPDDFRAAIEHHGESVALVMVGGVHYYTGQLHPLADLVRWGHAVGAMVGFDLAHAVGNVPLQLHNNNADFAVWCSYKYLNGGAGCVGGAFVHQRHATRFDLKRMAGWWGNDPATRFGMQGPFVPRAGAHGWQLSNAPVFNMIALEHSLEAFAAVGMAGLRKRSVQMTGAVLAALQGLQHSPVEVITPLDPEARGAQLSLRLPGRGQQLQRALHARGIVADYRNPDVVRVAPAPLYNRWEDAARLVAALSDAVVDA